MWTYSGMFIERTDEGKFRVWTDTDEERKIFADKYGWLDGWFIEEYGEQMKEVGLYQVLSGYGSGCQDPVFYDIRYMGKVDWNLKGGSK